MINPTHFSYKMVDNGTEFTFLAFGRNQVMVLPIDPHEYWRGYNSGYAVQKAFPKLTATQREFLITGMDEEEQKKFGW
jgi:hypothetical protein